MAQVEIYKLKKTVAPQVRDFSVFDYMDKGVSPDPMHYVKEWAGGMHGTLPLTIPGRLMLEPPKNYQGGDIKNGDIAVVDGNPFFFDKLHGSKFIEMEKFDATAVREAIHPKYGFFVDITGAEAMSNELAAVCEDIGVPCGYLGEQSAGGVYNDKRPFLPGVSNKDHLSFLHPEFLIGEEAREFIGLLSELSEAEHWPHISALLYERYPINMDDLRDARECFAPELLLPAELRPLVKVIPADADKAELDYLTSKISCMDGEQRNIFYAVIEGGLCVGDKSIAEFINITENLDCFDIEPAFDESQYGEFRLKNDYDICEMVISRLEKSEDHAERFLAKYITLLNRCADEETYGYHAAKEDGGAFTKSGYISQVRPLEDIYRGLQDISLESPAISQPSATETKEPLIMIYKTDLSALLLEIHAVSGDYMQDASRNIKTLVNGGDNFMVMLNAGMLTVTPVNFMYRQDMHEYEQFMLMDKATDTRTYFMSVTERNDGRITGNLCEIDFWEMRDSISENSFYFIHMDAEMKDGTSRRLTLDEYDAMSLSERNQINQWVKRYDSADEADLAAHINSIRLAFGENRQPVAVGEFLSQINTPYMAQANNPQPNMLRVTLDAAKDILAQDAAHVFRLSAKGMEKLSAIDAVKSGLQYSVDREFAVRLYDWAGIEKWAQRSAGDILRQIERADRDKTKNKREEL